MFWGTCSSFLALNRRQLILWYVRLNPLPRERAAAGWAVQILLSHDARGERGSGAGRGPTGGTWRARWALHEVLFWRPIFAVFCAYLVMVWF